MRTLVAVLALAGCANEPFTYTVSVPPTHVVEGHEGQTSVEVVFDSYDAALEDLSLVVTQGTSRRQLTVGCGGMALGTPLGERVSFSATLFIDTRTCTGTDSSFVIADCGC